MSLPLPCRARLFFCCAALLVTALPHDAFAAVQWRRVGTVTTLTNNQVCYTDGTDIICDTNAPTLSGGLVGIGSTSPVSSLDLSQKTDALALPSGSSAQRPTAVNGMIRYNTGGSGSLEAYLNGAWQTLLSGSSGAGQAAGSNWQVQYNNAGSLAGGTNFVWDNANGRVGVGTAAPQAPLHLAAENASGNAYLDTYSNLPTQGSGFLGRRARGSLAVPSAAQASDTLAVFGARGYGATDFSATSRANMGFYAAENWSDTAQGAYISFKTTPAGGTATAEAMRIDSAGKVGIGTTSPTLQLSVVANNATGGVFNISNSSSAGYSAFDIYDDTGMIRGGFGYGNSGATAAYAGKTYLAASNPATPLALIVNSAERLRITPSGRVGIGTTNPSSSKLEMWDVDGGSMGVFGGTSSLSESIYFVAQNRARFGYEAARQAVLIDDKSAAGLTTSKSVVFDTAGSERMRITTGGNVGIGTTSPLGALSVDRITAPDIILSANGVEHLTMGASSPTAGLYSNIAAAGDGVLRAATNNMVLTARNASGNVYIATGSPDTAKVTVLSGGNVGIGTTNPANTLQVNGGISANGNGNFAGAGAGAAISMYENGSTGYISSATSGTGWNPIVLKANTFSLLSDATTQGIYQDASGKVAIGTTAPRSLLSVYGGGLAVGTYANMTTVGVGSAAFSGSVGIGTPGPSYALDVVGTGTYQARVGTSAGNLSLGFDGSNPRIDSTGGVLSINSNTGAVTAINNGAGGGAVSLGRNNQFYINTSGNVGIGTTSPGSSLQVNGGAAVGYSTSTAAPSNGLAVRGQVGIGTASPAANVAADVNGLVKVAGTGSEPCTAAQVGSIRYNPSGNYFELCSYP